MKKFYYGTLDAVEKVLNIPKIGTLINLIVVLWFFWLLGNLIWLLGYIAAQIVLFFTGK